MAPDRAKCVVLDLRSRRRLRRRRVRVLSTNLGGPVKKPLKHPEDVIAVADAVGRAAGRFATWKAGREHAIDALVLTYSDEDAACLLAVLREEFWSEP
jgi:hypothetical protein